MLLLVAAMAGPVLGGCAAAPPPAPPAPAEPASVTSEFVVTGMTRTKAGYL